MWSLLLRLRLLLVVCSGNYLSCDASFVLGVVVADAPVALATACTVVAAASNSLWVARMLDAWSDLARWLGMSGETLLSDFGYIGLMTC